MKNKYKDSKVQWIGEVPIHWDIKRIKRFAQVKRGASPRPIDDAKYFADNGEYAWVRIADVSASGRYLKKTTQVLSKLGASLSVKQNPGDLFISIAGTVGKPIITQIKCCIHDGFIWFDNPKFNKDYLYYIFLSEAPYQGLGKLGTQLNLNTDTIGRIFIPVPSIKEQIHIAAYLDKTCTAIDKTIEAKQKQLEILDALRKSIIHKAVTRGLDDSVELKDSGVEWLGRIPRHWNSKHLKRVCSKIQTGNTPPTANIEYYIDGTIPWYAPGCYDGGIYLQKPAKKINEVAYFNNKLRMFPANSIFIIGIGATIGKVAMTRVEASCNQQIIALVCNSNVYAKYLAYHLKIFETIIPRIAQFTTLPIMDQNKIGYLQIAVPPIKEQRKITKFLDNKIIINNRLENNLVNQISTLNQYRKSLIHECVTGKRRVNKDDVQEQLCLQQKK